MHHISVKDLWEKRRTTARAKSFRNTTIVAWGAGLPIDATLGVSFFCMAIKKTQLYSILWESCNILRGSMDASQYKNYVLTMLFLKYISDRVKSDPDLYFELPEGCSCR